MASRGVTTPATQDVVRVTSADGRPPGTDRQIEAGDLVAFDAGVVADGYVGETGRTWPAGPDASDARTEDLRGRWDRLRTQLLDACRPGTPASALLDAYREAGEPLPATPVGRGLGLGFDDPVIVRDLPATAAAERMDPGVVLVVTGCVFDDTVGAVIGHQPVLITPDGPEVLSSSPFWTPEQAGAHA
jgi:Xaa-Pro dipeptidase